MKKIYMQKIILLKGLPASGKTTWALQKCLEDSEFKRINKDDIRASMPVQKWSKDFESTVLHKERLLGIDFIQRGYNLIVDDTNFNSKHENFWKDIALKYNCDFEIMFFDTSVKECIQRDSKRSSPVGKSVIKRMFFQNRELFSNESIKDPRTYLVQDVGLIPAIICDLDGTLSLINDRSPYDYNSVGKDTVNEPIRKILENYSCLGYTIIYLSGRMEPKETEKDLTLEWLNFNDLTFHDDFKIFRRKNGDYRQDAIIKEELFDTHIKNVYHIDFVLDDRNQVVDMWRRKGLLCLQVYYGDF